MTNPDLSELAKWMFPGTNAEPAVHGPVASEPSASEILEPEPEKPIEVKEPPALPITSERDGLMRTSPIKQKKTADELAVMILEDLSGIEGCPKRGVNVTVYGSNPWNAWLSFGGAAGPVRNKADLQRFCEIITERLKRLYDV